MQLDHLQKSLDLAEALGFVQTQKKAQTLALLQEPWLEEARGPGGVEDGGAGIHVTYAFGEDDSCYDIVVLNRQMC